MMIGAPVRWIRRAYRGETKADISHIVTMFGICVTIYGSAMFVLVPWLLAFGPVGCCIAFVGLNIGHRWVKLHKPRPETTGRVYQAPLAPIPGYADVKVTVRIKETID